VSGGARAALATVAIASVRPAEARARLLEACCSPAEAAELAPRHPRTTAGFLAVKDALCELYGELAPTLAVARRDFVLGHDERGAPIVVAAPPLEAALSISISHTRDHAYGLAVADEVRRG
jgi:phosphopantetheinyl transferase (holo-ACP synthase)